MKGYSSGLRHGRATILNRQEQTVGAYGIDSGGVGWTAVATVWVYVSFNKGMRAMREGALDVYGVEMFRMNWNPDVTMRSRIIFDGQTYQILGETFHADFQANQVQFQAQIVIEGGSSSSSISSIGTVVSRGF